MLYVINREGKMFKKYPFMKQQATKECAAASVWMIVKYYKGHVSMNKLCYMLRITKNGTTAYHIIETLNCLGFNAKGLRLKKIDSIKTPFIAHVIINKTYKHFIVVYEINKDFLLIADPARGIKKVSYDDFYSMWTGVVITMYPVRLLIKEKEISPVVFCINFVKKYRYMLIKIGLLSLIITVLSVFSAFFFQTLIDYMEDIVNVSFFFILIIFINIVITYYRNRLLIIFSNKIGKDLLNKFFKQILSLPYLYYSRYTTGEVMSRFNDLYLLQNFFSKSLVIIFLDLPLCLFSGIVLFSLNKILFMIVLFTLIFYIFVITVFHHKNLAFINDYQDKKALVNSYMTECVSGINTIKGLNAEKRVYQKFYFKHQVFLETDLRANFLANLISCLKDFIGSFGYVLSLIIGIILVQKGTLPLSYLITYVFLTNFFLNPIRSLFDLDFEFKESLNALRRILELTIERKICW